MRRVALAIRQISALYVKVTLCSNSDQKMASMLSLTVVLEAVLDDNSDDFGLSEDESSEGEDEGIISLCRTALHESRISRLFSQSSRSRVDYDSDSADSIYLTDSEEEAEQFQGK